MNECRSGGLDDLAISVDRVQQYVIAWWATTYLPWFTDHGPEHSKRVAKYALDIAAIPSLSEQHKLTTLEKFILWSSAWLHDLGMQSLLGNALGPLDSAVYDQIRHEHPDQSCTEILTHGEAIGLPSGDIPLIQCIAYVARAHGTKHYTSSVESLQTCTHVRNEPVRAPLLASILLLADELDLHYQRARPPAAHANLNYVSQAHALKHKCVISCEVEHRPGGVVSFSLRTQRFPDIPSIVADEIDQWITEKLRRQIALVEKDFAEGFAGTASLSRSIRLTHTTAHIPVGMVSPETISIIRDDNAQDDLINHRGALSDLLRGGRQPGTFADHRNASE
ncbi:hypothetical protein [Sinomonas sp. ASV322]|uniref:HD domain-containing protein n=1 Tax=Sinomonas sp. ASV322 TaxID=3041920 RepID=UPI0027DC2F8A|nr:hypothetical protein [Sinomonas sp. ASV322]MDQ4502824.1 hypothetical protein [Sinomonas sp. ASV322]